MDVTDSAERLPRPLSGAAVFLALALYAYPFLLQIPLLDPDEGLHAAIAQEMVESRRYVTPRFGGEPFLDKPVLYFWAQAAALSGLGMNEAAVRLPGIAFTLLGNLTTGLLGWRVFGRRCGLIAALFHATLILPAAVGQFGVHDVALVSWVNLAILCFWKTFHAEPPSRGAGWALLGGFWLGLAILTKGLLGVAIVGLAVGGYAIATRRLSLRRAIFCVAAVPVAALMAAPWYVAMSLENPGYANYFFLERHLGGYLTESQRHGDEPWWYYVPALLAGGLPWIGYLPLSAQRKWRLPDGDDATTLLWIWLVGGALFLTVAQSKMVTYALPLFPAIALLAADPWARLSRGQLAEPLASRLRRVAIGGTLFGPLLLPIAMLIIAAELKASFPPSTWAVGMAVSCFCWWSIPFWRNGRSDAALAASLVWMGAAFVFVMTVLVPQIAPPLTAKPLAEYVAREMPDVEEILVVNERVGSLVFYLPPEVRSRLDASQVRHISLGDLLKMPSLGRGSLVVFPTKRIDEAKRCRRLAEAPFETVGHYHLCRGELLDPYLRK